MTALGLLLLAGCVVLAASPGTAGDTAQFLEIVLAVLALAVPLVVWWRRGMTAMVPTVDRLDQARKALAEDVAEQWRQEFVARSLGNPEPMPVCWKLGEPTVMDHPRLIAAGEPSFAGRSDEIDKLAAEFRRLRHRRLVILGGPGTGKTTLAVQLLLELLDTRQAGEPIPVLVSLAGWNPAEQPQFHEWLATRLAEDYPSLNASGPGIAHMLTRRGHLLPILDGLDEIPESRRPEVIRKLNESLTDTDQLVLTSRTDEYTTTTKAREVLRAAAVIAPEPLTAAQAAEYLRLCLPTDPSPSWRKLLHRLRTGTAEHLATLLATPLNLWLLRTVYLAPGADPTPLLNPDTTPEQDDLFDQLIPAVLTTRPASRHHCDLFRPRRTWHANDVRRWLTYLAHQLRDPKTNTNTRDLYWWRLARKTLTPRPIKLVVGLVFGLVFGVLAALVYEPVAGLAGFVGGLMFGLTLGPTFGLMFGPTAQRWLRDEHAYANLRLQQRVKLLTHSLGVGLAVTLTVALPVGLAVGLTLELTGKAGGLMVGLVGGLMLGLASGVMIGLTKWVGTPDPADWASGPQSTYRATRTLTLLQLGLALLAAGLASELVGRLVDWLTGGVTIGPASGVTIGLVAGLATGLAAGMAARRKSGLVVKSGAWLTYALTICRLAASGKLPLRLMSFLDDAYRLGLLRTVGPAYQFRHAEFQDHLCSEGQG